MHVVMCNLVHVLPQFTSLTAKGSCAVGKQLLVQASKPAAAVAGYAKPHAVLVGARAVPAALVLCDNYLLQGIANGFVPNALSVFVQR